MRSSAPDLASVSLARRRMQYGGLITPNCANVLGFVLERLLKKRRATT